MKFFYFFIFCFFYSFNSFAIEYSCIDKKLSRKADCLAIRGRSHAIIKKASIQKVTSNMEPFFIK